MKSWLQSITVEDTGIIICILLLLFALRLALMIVLHKSFLEERVLLIINRIANIVFLLISLALIITAVDNSPLYVNHSPLSLPVTKIKP